MEKKMYCNQCQETANNIACMLHGVCGKNPILANQMDVLKEYLKVLSKQIDGKDNVKDEKHFIMHSLFKLITNANFNEVAIAHEIDHVRGLTKVDVVEPYYESNEDLNSLKSLIMSGLMGMCAYHAHAIHLGFEDDTIHNFMIHTLATMNDINDLTVLVALSDEIGSYGVKVMALLDKANTSTFGNPEISEVNLGVHNRPGILVSGHDLNDLEQLLIQSENSGVDIYTHSEMLPAHYYPNLKKYSHLVGNYGNAWWQQREEFESFNGPILFTTNCIVPPKKDASYLDRLYSTGDCDAPNFKRIEVIDGKKDFSAIIEQAKQCPAPVALESGTLVGGFAHNQVIALADTIVEKIKSGAIKEFVVMSGCDGRSKDRNYYTDFANNLPDSSIILTSGCAKYRYNKLNLGSIEGIPRVLDAGQCNDSYSLAVIALKLKEVFALDDINELPITYNIAWYEQKAIIVLLALLHLGVKNIKVGPTLPGYLSPTVTNFLVDTYHLSTPSVSLQLKHYYNSKHN